MEDLIRRLAERNLRTLRNQVPGTEKLSFRMAGGCLLPGYTVNDYDLYEVITGEGTPVRWARLMNDSLVLRKAFRLPESQGLYLTSNAASFTVGTCRVQVCSHHKDTLAELVDSFDFSHCQVGAAAVKGEITEVYCSKAFEQFIESGESVYTGSEYPLSSICRVTKYVHKGVIRDPRGPVMSALAQFVRLLPTMTRSKFLDQLEAVDMQLLSPGQGPAAAELWTAISEAFEEVSDG